MPGFIVRPGGSREYFPKEYRGAPQDYYATRMREAMRNGKNSLQMKRASAAGLEKDMFMKNELARLRSRFRQLSNKTWFGPRKTGIQIAGKRPIRFAPRV